MTALETFLNFIGTRNDAAEQPLQRVRVWAAKCASELRTFEPGGADALRTSINAGAADLPDLPDGVSASQREAVAGVAASLQHESESALAKLGGEQPDFASEVLAFTAAAGALQKLCGRTRRRARLLQIAKVAVYVIPAAGAYLAGVYLRFDKGVYRLSDAVLFPAGAYDARVDNAYTLNADFEKRYFDEFSRSYFNRPNSFASFFDRSKEERVPEVQMKLALRNPTRAEALMLSTVQVSARIRETPFPWNRVNVTPNVRAEVKSSVAMLSNDKGIGPALELKYALQSGEWLLDSGQRDALLNTITINARSPMPGIGTVWLDQNGSMARPLYRAVATSGGDVRGDVINCPDGQYETIATLDHLATLTPVLRGGGSAKLTWSYASLRGERYSDSTTVPLPKDLAYYRQTSRLLERAPCSEFAPPPIADGLAPDSPNVLDLLDIALPAAPPKAAGKDIIVSRVALSMKGIRDGQRTTAIVSPDELLGAGGILLVYVQVTDVRNGLIDLDLNVNGKTVDHVTIPTLVADRMRFDARELEQEKARFAPVKR